MYGAMDVLLPHIPKAEADKRIGMVIGVVEGDVHDIGKSIVKTMCSAAGFDVHDLGRVVPPETFVAKTKETKSHVVAMRTLMTPTKDGMKAVMDGLVEAGVRMNVKTIIGGAPTSKEFAYDIGADFWAGIAQDAVVKIKGAL